MNRQQLQAWREVAKPVDGSGMPKRGGVHIDRDTLAEILELVDESKLTED